MPDLLSTSLSGLLAFQRAIDTTSHNIANVNTAGYSRQRVEFGTRPASPLGNGWVGNGVEINTVRRLYDEYLVAQTRTAASSLEQQRIIATQAERVSNLFGNSEAGIAAALQKFNNAVQSVAASPTSIPARQVLLGEARTTAERIQYFDTRMREFETEANSRIAAEIGEINALAQGLARLNQDIVTGTVATGEPPNDLLDQRDELLDRLASKINISIVPGDDGVLNVFVGRGQVLVLNYSASRLSTQGDAYDPGRTSVVLREPGGSTDITESLTGGSLGGLLQYRSDVLDPARNALGRIAVGVATAFNEQHRRGMDLSGALGQDFFSVGAPAVLPSSANAGSGSVVVSRETVQGLVSSDYILEYTGAAWALRRADSGQSVALAGTGSVADPLRAEGLAIVVGGTPAAADRYLVRPLREAPQGFAAIITNAAQVAVAVPVRAEAGPSNSGSAVTTAGEVIDPSNPALRSTVTLQFASPTTYSINGAGSFTYTSGQPITYNGWRISISGVPAIGDQFIVTDNTAGVGDNRNAQALADAMSRPLLDGGAQSLSNAVGAFVSDIGVRAREAAINRDTQSLMYEDVMQARRNTMGVNLDEEAANLVRFQQAYQAVAQLIRTASTIFDALLAATRR
jgi:flagellar hook-associated protein 1 FlgK